MNNLIHEDFMKNYEIIKLIGKGTFSYVWQIKNKNTYKIYALKKIFNAFENNKYAQRTYREIMNLILLRNFSYIVNLFKIFISKNNLDCYLIFEYVDYDLKYLIKTNNLNKIQKKKIIYELLLGLKNIHKNNIIHRDLKLNNILVDKSFNTKIADFGLSRTINYNNNNEDYYVTEDIGNLYYRAPEVLFQSKNYNLKADIWSLGCLIYEILTGNIIFKGSSIVNQIENIINIIGYPDSNDIESFNSPMVNIFLKNINISGNKEKNNIFNNVDKEAADLLKNMLILNHNKRMSIIQLLNHSYFNTFKKSININFIKNNKKIIIEDKKLLLGNYFNEIKKNILKYNQYLSNKKLNIIPNRINKSSIKLKKFTLNNRSRIKIKSIHRFDKKSIVLTFNLKKKSNNFFKVKKKIY